MKTITFKNVSYSFDFDKHDLVISQGEKLWSFSKKHRPYLSVLPSGSTEPVTFYFDEAVSIKSVPYSTGVADGMRTEYKYWKCGNKNLRIKLTTLMWVHKTSGRLYFELIPISEPNGADIQKIQWPAPFEWERSDADAYTLFPLSHGIMIPSNWDKNVTAIGSGKFLSVYGNMPWIGQVDHRKGYLSILETPWDAGFYYAHTPETPTDLSIHWLPSLGKIGYRRVLRTEFFDDCDYVTLCKSFRNYVKENGNFHTLRQKRELLPTLDNLIGSPVIHSCIYYNIKPEAFIYDKDHPDKNFRFTTFDRRADQIAQLKKNGLGKAYLHLDGWGADGYDWDHPDILPPCEKAGGKESMKRLIKKCRENDVLFALHDQYHDYYFDAESFDRNNAVMDVNGEIPTECVWNGGDQAFLCETLAPYYVERNYDQLRDMGIVPDGVYLDVFSCTALDECNNSEHRMTRRECVSFRAKCMALLAARGILISSESLVDCFMPYLVLCHHFPMYEHVKTSKGVAVPLFNLCYHDCAIVPWLMHEEEGTGIETNRYLNAILNGGPAYLDIAADADEISKIAVVSELQEKLAYCEMVSHEFLSEDYQKQRTVFSDGTAVTVDFRSGDYQLEHLDIE